MLISNKNMAKQDIAIHRFYRSDAWKIARAIKIANACGVCEECGGGVQVGGDTCIPMANVWKNCHNVVIILQLKKKIFLPG